jgi:hypothetical protein
MFWQITSYPRCEYHIFLSHCAGDRQTLDLAKVVVAGQPVHDALIGRPGLLERVTQFDPSPIR